MGLNTLVMFALTLFFMGLPWLAEDEKLLIWSSSAIQYANREVPSSSDYALINTSYDLQLIDHYDDYGFPVGNQAITDRTKLAEFLRIINSSPERPRYIICDIHFVDATESDSALHAQLIAYDNLIVSAHLKDDGQLDSLRFSDVKKGLSDYVLGSVFDGVYKYQLIHENTYKLLPLKVYEDLSGKQATKFGPFVKVGNRWTMNNFIMNYRLLQKDVAAQDVGFNPVNMGELLFLPEEDIQNYTAGKIVLIGDFFQSDMHETIFEISSGPLILLNALLTIQQGDTIVNVWLFLLIAVVYLCLSYMVFVEGDLIDTLINKITRNKAAKLLAGFTSYLLILSLLSLATFIFFNIHINFFFLAIAFYVTDELTDYMVHRRQKKKQQALDAKN